MLSAPNKSSEHSLAVRHSISLQVVPIRNKAFCERRQNTFLLAGSEICNLLRYLQLCFVCAPRLNKCAFVIADIKSAQGGERNSSFLSARDVSLYNLRTCPYIRVHPHTTTLLLYSPSNNDAANVFVLRLRSLFLLVAFFYFHCCLGEYIGNALRLTAFV